MKAVVRETIKAVQEKKKTVDKFKKAGFRKRPRDNSDQLSLCLMTPNKPKKAKKVKACADAHYEDSEESRLSGSPSQRSDI
ncbi:hypothetical protein Glove_423g77 [Diversispora epigaea]|uniref:Uncharacterized protein n=1 Tax=Diversispora epigaea TaxID=1348612 RepID=A0A397GZ70_9GLOM|nr:hypothetical protein Glove_423g77 [Diversispora epigaea]